MNNLLRSTILVLATALLVTTVLPARRLASSLVSRAGRILETGRMSSGRSGHTATQLTSGRVFVAGGMVRNGEFLADSELYDPADGKFTTAAKMSTRRVSHTATLLLDGRVLIAGGIAGRHQANGHWTGEVVASTELFDPAKGTFTPTGSLNTARSSHAAVLLPNGKVLILGGSGGGDWRELLASAELYDPATGKFTPAGSMLTPRIPAATVLLKNGKVLVAGGTGPNRTVLASAEICDPATGRFTPAGTMTAARHKHAAALLADGRVLITGGSDERDWQGQTASAEIYDPARGTFTAAAKMSFARFKHGATMVRLPDGRIVVAGGGQRVEVFDPASGTFRAAEGSLDAPWHFSTATLLADGRVLITGGYGNSPEGTPRAWLYQP